MYRRGNRDGRLLTTTIELVLRTGKQADEDGAQQQEEQCDHKEHFRKRSQRLLYNGHERRALGLRVSIWMVHILEERSCF